MTQKEIITTKNAPQAIGPYSVGVKAGNLVFTAGQLGINPQSGGPIPDGGLVPGGIEAETRQALKNLSAVLEAAGTSLANVVKTTVFLRDMNDFGAMNAVYAEFFTPGDSTGNYPARSAVQAARLPKDAAVEIEAVAVVSET